MRKIFTIGEALIDFIPEQKGVGLKEVRSFQKAPGGAPANVAATVSLLGGESFFIGKLGQDAFGDFLVETLKNVGVETDYIFRTNKANTALAFVSLKEDGERDFSFYRNPSADMLLDESEINQNWFNAGDILHFCSVSLVDAPVRKAHIAAIEAVKEAGGIISFDPNIRLPLWHNYEEYKNVIRQFIKYADILKISQDELEFITGINEEEKAIQWLLSFNVEVLLITRGSRGVSAYFGGREVTAEGYKVKAVDTTGAGDSFIGAFLYQVCSRNLSLTEILNDEMASVLKFSNAVAALTTMSKGAISALPSLEAVENFMMDSN
ncbi:carbohydrate kinase [Clostridium sp. SYSU_GA19001]|uniref:carbohydrate kinase family protein n=1 Tax=Clostridium caldaquaticum TaxID=2940653 RepID=UPI00207707B4|nr:carbohydrate kinase [Clostridium caldaquaticum]MCM8711842.1 carbohydrate kinase [Clostridium caldaquaticum]